MRRLSFSAIFFTGLLSIQFINAAQRHKTRTTSDLTMGELALLHACRRGNTEHLRLLVKQEKIDPNFKDLKTGKTPFSIALKSYPAAAKALLDLGAQLHLYLRPTRSIYSESFKHADERAIDFLVRQQGIPYVTKTTKKNKKLCQKLDLKRLLTAGNSHCLGKACKAGLIPTRTLRREVLRLQEARSKNAGHKRQLKLLYKVL